MHFAEVMLFYQGKLLSNGLFIERLENKTGVLSHFVERRGNQRKAERRRVELKY